jgi:hypothetical protein
MCFEGLKHWIRWAVLFVQSTWSKSKERSKVSPFCLTIKMCGSCVWQTSNLVYRGPKF